jgi:hypothetical protein
VERQQIIEVIESEQTLPQKIREVVLDRGTAPFDKRREIAGIIENALRERGSFLRTADGRVFFFSKDERKVLDVEQTEFRRTLTQISGLSVTENFLKFSLDVLQAKTSKTAPLAEVHTFVSLTQPTASLRFLTARGECGPVHSVEIGARLATVMMGFSS